MKRSIVWSTDDFCARALNQVGAYWFEVFDETKFEKALNRMIDNHDADEGISWNTVDYYLNSMCLRYEELSLRQICILCGYIDIKVRQELAGELVYDIDNSYLAEAEKMFNSLKDSIIKEFVS